MVRCFVHLMMNFMAYSLICLTFGGCLVGPDLAPPTPPELTNPYSVQPASAQAIPLEQWWQAWSDPKLSELLQIAGQGNLEAKQAYARIAEARAIIGVARGALGPTLSLLSEYSFRSQSENASPFVGSVGNNGDSFNLFLNGADSSWQVDLFGQIHRSIQAAEANTLFAEFDAQDIRRTLFSDVATNYLRIRLLQEQISLLQQSIAVQEQTQKLVSDREDAGVSTELDSAQTQSFVLRSKTLLASLEQQLVLEFNSLSVLMGQVPSQQLKDFIQDGGTVGLPSIPDIGFPTNVLRNRPDVRREEMAFVATLAEIGVAEADLYPQLTLLGSISVSAQSISSLFQTESLAFNIGPSLRWNIFQSGRIRANIEAARARCEQAQFNYQQTVISAVREVEDSIAQYNGFTNQTRTLSMAVEADQRAVALSLERYKAGRANFQRVLDSQQQQLQDLQLRASVRVQALEQAVRLYNALGGNWDYHSGAIASQASCSVISQPQLPVTAHSPVAETVVIPQGNFPYPLEDQPIVSPDQILEQNDQSPPATQIANPPSSDSVIEGNVGPTVESNIDGSSAQEIDFDNLSSLNDG